MTRIRRTVLLACLVPIGAAACDSWLTHPARYNTVSVTVTRRNGDAIDSVALELYTGQRPMGYGATDATGHYEFTLVPDGLYGVSAIPPSSYVPIESLVAGPPTTAVSGLQLAQHDNASAHFTFLKRGPGTLAVHVTDDAGAPVTGLFASLYDPTSTLDSLPTDSSGRATFSAVQFGVFGVSIPRPAAYRDTGETAFVQQAGFIIEDASHDSASFTLVRCQGSIKVTVHDDGGNLVPNYPVTLFVSTGTVADALTDASGTHTFSPIVCGNYGVRIDPLAGYHFVDTRGTSFFDGLIVTRGGALSESFVVNRN